jgi:type IV secretory pathway VirJ component
VIHRFVALVLAAAASLALARGTTAAGAEATVAVSGDAAPHAQQAAPKHKKSPARAIHDPLASRWINVAGFGEVAIYKAEAPAKGLALFASGDGGWTLGVLDMAHEAAKVGYWVAGFSTPTFLKGLDAGESACSDADGLLSKLGSVLVRELDLPHDTRPIVIGYSSGATIVYAALAADAGRRLGGGVSLGFCPDLLMKKPFCAGSGGLTQHKQQQPPFGYVFDKHETVSAPWRILQGEVDKVCDPNFAPDFADGQADSKAVMLPKVGHGFGVPRNWMPQYLDSLREVRDAPR